MKTSFLPLLLLLSIGLLSWSSCGNDNGLVIDTLNYDGPNFNAPTFGDAGLTTFAARFPAGETQAYVGRELEKISFYLEQIPFSTVVLVFEDSTSARIPGRELYSADLTQRIRNTGWVEHILPRPIEITGDGLWLAIEVDVDSLDPSIGCDQGTNYSPNGDRLQTPSGAWTSFDEITSGGERVNWNIRGIISEE